MPELRAGTVAVIALLLLIVGAFARVSISSSNRWGDVRAAQDVYVAPDGWTVMSQDVSRSRGPTIWNSGLDSTTVYSTNQTGTEACSAAVVSLREFSGLEQLRVLSGPDQVARESHCYLRAQGDFHGIQIAFIWVRNQPPADGSQSETTGLQITMVLRKTVNLVAG